MQEKSNEELYKSAVQSILNDARDEMIASNTTSERAPDAVAENKLAALRKKLGL